MRINQKVFVSLGNVFTTGKVQKINHKKRTVTVKIGTSSYLTIGKQKIYAV